MYLVHQNDAHGTRQSQTQNLYGIEWICIWFTIHDIICIYIYDCWYTNLARYSESFKVIAMKADRFLGTLVVFSLWGSSYTSVSQPWASRNNTKDMCHSQPTQLHFELNKRDLDRNSIRQVLLKATCIFIWRKNIQWNAMMGDGLRPSISLVYTKSIVMILRHVYSKNKTIVIATLLSTYFLALEVETLDKVLCAVCGLHLVLISSTDYKIFSAFVVANT